MTINDGRLIVDLFPGVFLWMELTSSTLIELSYIYSLASLDSPSLRQQFTMTRFTLPGYDVTERKVMLGNSSFNTFQSTKKLHLAKDQIRQM